MKNTGLLLKHKRERSNLSLGEVALATKINPKILNAIENGDESALPAKTFLKGFVRSYAAFLKMDVDEVMRSFNEEMGPTIPVVPKVEVIPEGKAAQDAPPPGPSAASSRRPVDEDESRRGLSVAVVMIVILIGMIIGVRELIDKYQREKVVEVPADLKAKPLANPEPPALPSPAPASVEAAVKVEEPTKAEPAKVEPAKVEPPKAEVVKAEAPPKTEPVPAPPPVEAKPAPPTITPSSPLVGVKTEIILEALDSVDVKFELKGEKKKVSLAPSQVHTIRTTEPVTLDFSDGGAVNIILNGRERGVPGDLGKPKTIKIP